RKAIDKAQAVAEMNIALARGERSVRGCPQQATRDERAFRRAFPDDQNLFPKAGIPPKAVEAKTCRTGSFIRCKQLLVYRFEPVGHLKREHARLKGEEYDPLGTIHMVEVITRIPPVALQIGPIEI